MARRTPRVPRTLIVLCCSLMAAGLVAGVLWARGGLMQGVTSEGEGDGEGPSTASAVRGGDDDEAIADAHASREVAGGDVTSGSDDGGVASVPDGTGSGEGGWGADASTCPLEVPGGVPAGGRRNALGRSWMFTTEEGSDEVAVETLHQLQEGGFQLVHASQLDLFGEAWGCVAREEGEVVLVFSRSGSLDPGVQPTQVSVVSLEPR